jgi:hypothetical protein
VSRGGLHQVRRKRTILQGAWRRQALRARGLLQVSRSSSRQHALHAVSAAHTAACSPTMRRRSNPQHTTWHSAAAAGGGLRINQLTAEARPGLRQAGCVRTHSHCPRSQPAAFKGTKKFVLSSRRGCWTPRRCSWASASTRIGAIGQLLWMQRSHRSRACLESTLGLGWSASRGCSYVGTPASNRAGWREAEPNRSEARFQVLGFASLQIPCERDDEHRCYGCDANGEADRCGRGRLATFAQRVAVGG